MTGSLDAHYDFALLGTSLPLSILSAALSRAGYSILHIDEEEHYGGPWSSLTLTELLAWSSNAALHTSQGKHNVSVDFPAFAGAGEGANGAPPAQLAGLNRHFAISLAPMIVPCAGPTIDVLIRSKVASYCTFRLLQRTAVFTAQADWPLKRVPSSKEDIFKDKSLGLVDKRRLMKLLQQASPEKNVDESDSAVGTQETALQVPFVDYLRSKDGANLSLDLAISVAYGVALCSSPLVSSASAMERIRRHIGSIGRYGNAAYLVGQYGGAGEMAQCFCRASAVQGGTFVLGHQVERCARERQEADEDSGGASNWTISLAGIEGHTRVEHIVGDDDLLKRIHPAEAKVDAAPSSISAILLLDRGIRFDSIGDAKEGDAADSTPPETGLVVFPPQDGSAVGTVTALQMAEGTFSCPKGMYLIYLDACVQGEVDAREALRPAREEVLKLAGGGAAEWKAEGIDVRREGKVLPLMECYYTSSKEASKEVRRGANCWVAHSSMASIASSLDEATLHAEDLFWDIVGKERRAEVEEARRRRKPVGYSVGQGLGGVLETKESDLPCDFFPAQDRDDDDDDN